MDSKNEPNTTQPCPQFVDYLFLWTPLTWCRRPKYFSLCTYLESGIVGFSNHGDVYYILAMFGRGRPVKVDAILFKIVLKCAKECLILKCKYSPESLVIQATLIKLVSSEPLMSMVATKLLSFMIYDP